MTLHPPSRRMRSPRSFVAVVAGALCALATGLTGQALARLDTNRSPEATLTVLEANGQAALDAGNNREAADAFEAALALRERLGRAPEEALDTAVGLRDAYRRMGLLEPAQKATDDHLARVRRSAGPRSSAAARLLYIGGNTLTTRGLYREAEAYQRESVAIYEELGTAATPADLAGSLLELGYALEVQGLHADAEALSRRAMAILERAHGREHELTASAMIYLAIQLDKQGRFADAEPIHRDSLRIRKAALGLNHAWVAFNLHFLGENLLRQARFSEAEQDFAEALRLREQVLKESKDQIAASLDGLAEARAGQSRLADAEATIRRAIAIKTEIFSDDNPETALSFHQLSTILTRRGDRAGALDAVRRAAAVRTRYMDRQLKDSAGEHDAQRRLGRDIFVAQIAAALAVRPPTDGAIVDETFAAGQQAQTSSVARNVAQSAARFAAGSDQLARTVRERDDKLDRRKAADAQLLQALSRDMAARDRTREAQIRADIVRLDAELADIARTLVAQFPAYAELTQPRPLTVAQAQQLLQADEALLVYTVAAEETWLWALRRDGVALHRIDIGAAVLLTEITALRARLDPDLNPNLEPFDTGRAYALHRRILAPATALLAGARHVFVVPDGALQSLPLGVLVTAEPAAPTDYRQVAWLARRVAVTTLPSVSSLRALRQFAAAARATAPFVGIGDPVLEGAPGNTRGVKVATVFRGATGDVDAVRKLPALPDAGDELRTLATSQGAGEADLHLRERASETLVKALPLERYRVVAFATHGLIAGDFKFLAEPALVLTPPTQVMQGDDGLLTASEIAQLKLNADWVILSACNTAAGDGTPGADGLSGLAKAFFYAGSRALLVSHWPVETTAAVKLTTAAFELLKADPALGRAEALRRSEMAYLDDPSLPVEFTHPMVWAPFTVVGEGGPNR